MQGLCLYIKRGNEINLPVKADIYLSSLLLYLSQFLQNHWVSTPFLLCYFLSLIEAFKVPAADTE